MWTALHTVYCTSPSIPLSVCSLKGNSTIAKQCIVWAVIDATIENTNIVFVLNQPKIKLHYFLWIFQKIPYLTILAVLKEVGIETDWSLFYHLLYKGKDRCVDRVVAETSQFGSEKEHKHVQCLVCTFSEESQCYFSKPQCNTFVF